MLSSQHCAEYWGYNVEWEKRSFQSFQNNVEKKKLNKFYILYEWIVIAILIREIEGCEDTENVSNLDKK